MSDRDYLIAGLIHELAEEFRKAIAEQEKKAKENEALTSQDTKDESHQVATYSSSFTA